MDRKGLCNGSGIDLQTAHIRPIGRTGRIISIGDGYAIASDIDLRPFRFVPELVACSGLTGQRHTDIVLDLVTGEYRAIDRSGPDGDVAGGIDLHDTVILKSLCGYEGVPSACIGLCAVE